LIAYSVMLIGWPYAQQNPLRYPLRALMQMQKFDFPYKVLYRGQFIPAAKVPADYVFGYLAVTLPELILILLLVGAAFAMVGVFKHKTGKAQSSFLTQGCILLCAAVLIPIITAIVGHSTLYDGIRHFLFVIPPLVCLAAISLDALLERLLAWNGKAALAATLLLIVYLSYIVIGMVRLHPYEYIYYNRLAGGVGRAYLNYETDFWGTAVSQAARWLVNDLAERGKLSDGPVRVIIAGANDFSASYYFPPGIQFTADATQADYFIGGIRSFSQGRLPGEVIYTVRRMGVPLAVVKELNP
jgi:hypothetical protein